MDEMSTIVRVLLASDAPLLRRGLRDALATATGVHVTGEASAVLEPHELHAHPTADVVVLDACLSVPGALQAVARAAEHRPKLPVLMLGTLHDEAIAVRVLRAGAAGYLSVRTHEDQLVQAVRAVAAGQKYLSAQAAHVLAAHVAGGGARETPLSRRELEVLQFIATGHTTGQIAVLTGLSVKTVATYRARLLEKTRLRTTADLVRYALRHHLVE
jgi:DNA-binding NarL/FixJ family response regulator